MLGWMERSMLLRHGPELLEPGAAKKNTRHQLIVATALLLQRRGFYGIGTSEILELAGAPRGSLYHHFPGGKTEVTAAAINWVSDEAVSHIQQLRQSGRDARTIIEVTAMGIGAWMETTDFGQGSLLAAMASCLNPNEEQLRAAVQSAYAALASEFEIAIRLDGIDGQTAKLIAESVVSEIEGATLLARAQRSSQPLQNASTRLTAQISSALRSAP